MGYVLLLAVIAILISCIWVDATEAVVHNKGLSPWLHANPPRYPETFWERRAVDRYGRDFCVRRRLDYLRAIDEGKTKYAGFIAREIHLKGYEDYGK